MEDTFRDPWRIGKELPSSPIGHGVQFLGGLGIIYLSAVSIGGKAGGWLTRACRWLKGQKREGEPFDGDGH